jgi:hypothetical protein
MKKILKLYLQASFTEADHDLINQAIEQRDIYTDDIKEDFMDYLRERLKAEGIGFSNERIWEYTDEHYDNGYTHPENYSSFLNFPRYPKYKFAISTSDGHDEDWFYFETREQYLKAFDEFKESESDIHGYELNSNDEYQVIDSYWEKN